MEGNLVSIVWKLNPNGGVSLYIVYLKSIHSKPIKESDYLYVIFSISKGELEFRQTLIKEARELYKSKDADDLKILEMEDRKNRKVILILTGRSFNIEYLNSDKYIKIPSTLNEKMSKFLFFLITK